MAQFRFTIRAKDLRQAIKRKTEDPIIALSRNPNVMRKIALKTNELVTQYVPKKTGDLRKSAHVVQHARYTQIVWGKPGVGKTMKYARYQHDADDSGWKRTTPGTKSYWTNEIKPGTPNYKKLVDYVIPLVKKEVKNGSK